MRKTLLVSIMIMAGFLMASVAWAAAVRMACPGCGKPLTISTGSTHTCTKCRTKVTVDRNGNVVGVQVGRR